MSDVVIIGRPSDYEQTKTKRRSGVDSFITFEVVEIVFGKYTKRQIKAYIPISTYGAPRTLAEFKKHYGELVKFGVVLPETYSKWCKREERKLAGGQINSSYYCHHKNIAIEITPEDYPDMPSLVRQHCTRLYIETIE